MRRSTIPGVRSQTGSPLARAALLATALLSAGWLALMLHDQRLQDSAVKLLQQRPPQLAAARAKLESAGRLSASLQPRQIATTATFFSGDAAGAATQLRKLLADEPRNRTGWLLLGTYLERIDPRGAAQARARAAVLDGHPGGR